MVTHKMFTVLYIELLQKDAYEKSRQVMWRLTFEDIEGQKLVMLHGHWADHFLCGKLSNRVPRHALGVLLV